MSNHTCNTAEGDMMAIDNEIPMLGKMTFHQIILLTDLICVIFTFILSFYQISRHAFNYTRPSEQKHILRILFMVPLYGLTNLLSTKFVPYAIYFQILSSTYAAVAVASYFSLLCHYLVPDGNCRVFFEKVEPLPWQNYFPLPLRWLRNCVGERTALLRTLTDGLRWFNIISLGVFQYCLVRSISALASIITQAFGRYCGSSLSPEYCHIWTLSLNAFSATIAMYCLDQFTWQMKDELVVHRPTLKLWCVKIVFAVSMYQNLILALITTAWIPSKIAVRATDKLAFPDLRVGIPALMLCCECFFTSILHLHAFPWRVYKDNSTKMKYQGRIFGGNAVFDALNCWDLVCDCGGAMKWLVEKERKDWATEQVGTESSSSTVLLNDEKSVLTWIEIPIEDEVEQIRWLEPVYSKSEKRER